MRINEAGGCSEPEYHGSTMVRRLGSSKQPTATNGNQSATNSNQPAINSNPISNQQQPTATNGNQRQQVVIVFVVSDHHRHLHRRRRRAVLHVQRKKTIVEAKLAIYPSRRPSSSMPLPSPLALMGTNTCMGEQSPLGACVCAPSAIVTTAEASSLVNFL